MGVPEKEQEYERDRDRPLVPDVGQEPDENGAVIVGGKYED